MQNGCLPFLFKNGNVYIMTCAVFNFPLLEFRQVKKGGREIRNMISPLVGMFAILVLWLCRVADRRWLMIGDAR